MALCHNLGMSEPETSVEENEKHLQEFLQEQNEFMRQFVSMTPEEQEQWKQQMQPQGIRNIVSRAGFEEDVAQALIAFVAERAQSRRRLCAFADVLYLCESTKSSPSPSDAQIATLLEQYQAEAEAERARNEAAAQALDQTLGWSRSPRLKSFLLRTGLIGDARWLSHTDMMPPTGGGLDTGIVREWNQSKALPPEFAWLLDQDQKA